MVDFQLVEYAETVMKQDIININVRRNTMKNNLRKHLELNVKNKTTLVNEKYKWYMEAVSELESAKEMLTEYLATL